MSEIQNLITLTPEELARQGYKEVTKGNFKIDDLVEIERTENKKDKSTKITFAKLSSASYLFNKLCKIIINSNCKVFRKN